MDRNFYSYISAQKKYIEEFEKNELEDLVNKKAEQLKIPSEAVKSFLSFYHCKDFEESVQVIEKYFIDVIKKDNEIILNINNYNGMENVEIHYNLGSNKITVNIDEYTGDCKDFILERDEYLKSLYGTCLNAIEEQTQLKFLLVMRKLMVKLKINHLIKTKNQIM